MKESLGVYKMRKGAIVINPSVLDSHPYKRTIFIENQGRYTIAMSLNLKIIKYYTCDYKKWEIDGYLDYKNINKLITKSNTK